MGLDNGVILRLRRPLKFSEIPDGIIARFSEIDEIEKDKDGFYDYEICYWRKWWAMRNYFVEKVTGNCEGGDYIDLRSKDVEELIKYEYTCLIAPEGWDQIGNIFSFSEMVEKIAIDIAVLSWVNSYLLREGNGYLTFYDSY